jgi:hypothetical protein
MPTTTTEELNTKRIDWDKIINETTREDDELILEIMNRVDNFCVKLNRLNFAMDLMAFHHAVPLDLKQLLDSESVFFVPDVRGIMDNINRVTGDTNGFIPHCARKEG